MREAGTQQAYLAFHSRCAQVISAQELRVILNNAVMSYLQDYSSRTGVDEGRRAVRIQIAVCLERGKLVSP